LKEIIRGSISTKTGMCVDNISSADKNRIKLRSESDVLFYRRQNEANREPATKPQRLNALYEKPTV
jgi:hypothetical protein